MTEINVLNKKFEVDKKNKISTDVSLSKDDIHESSVHQVVKCLLANRRSGTASTKNRSQVSGGGKKPFRQKGTGRARQGSNRSPLMPGGGVAFGPTPRDFSKKVNKKMMLKAIHSVLADKFQAGKLTVLESFPETSKTKELNEALDSRKLLPGLLVADDRNNKALMASKNFKNGKGLPVEGFSVYEAVKYENLIIEKSAIEKLLKRIGG